MKARIGAAVPTQTNFGKDPEWGTLAREINKKARHMPLRQLFGRLPTVLTQLAPCVMMSPLSIAQYLPADAKPFDVVIFDEASQIPVWDAIGAIARGSQVAIVGDPEQLPPTNVGQRGVDDEDDDGSIVQSQQSILDECLVDFKHFLEFAENGARAIAEAFSPTGRDTESPFEDAVMRALQEKGWEVHPQVGVSFFRIDLGVVHPDFPGRYLAGVECDGAAYHRSATARDRDRLREMVLTDLGWRIRRIWSTEWWMDSTTAIEKIHARLVADLEADRASRPIAEVKEELATAPPEELSSTNEADEPAAAATSVVEAEAGGQLTEALEPANDDSEPVEQAKVYARGPTSKVGEPGQGTAAYVKADPSRVAPPDRERFYDASYRGTLRSMVDHVVDIEGPIYFDVIVDRIARAHGFMRSGETVQKIVASSLGHNRFPTTKDGERQIVWPQDATTRDSAPYRGAGGRDHSDIPLPELAGLAGMLRTTGLEEDEDIIRGMQEHFGLGRLAASTRERFEAAVAAAG